MLAAINDRDPAVFEAAMNYRNIDEISFDASDVSPIQLAVLIKYLRSEKTELRIAAAKALGKLREKSVVKALVSRLEVDDSWRVRKAAVEALGSLGDKSAMESLLKRLEDEDQEVHYAATKALGILGAKSALTSLVNQLVDEDLGVRIATIEALGALKDRSVMEVLVEQLESNNPRIRLAAVNALGALKDRSVVSSLVNRLKVEKERSVLITIAETLSSLGSNSVIQTLFKRTKNKELTVLVIDTLGSLGNKSVVPKLVEYLEDKYSGVRLAAVRALGKLRDNSVIDLIVKRLEDEDQEVRYRAAKALGKLGDKSVVNALVSHLTDEVPRVRYAIIEALGSLGDKSVVPPLVKRVENDKDSEVRYIAVKVLGILGDNSAVEMISKLVRDHEDSGVRYAAAEALGRLGDRSVIETLDKRLMEENNSLVRIAIAKALVELGDTSTLKTLVTLLGDADSDIRNNSAMAIKNLGPLGIRETLQLLELSYNRNQQYAEIILFCYLLSDVEDPIRAAVQWLGRRVIPFNSYLNETLGTDPAKARDLLKNFSYIWKASEIDKKLLYMLRKDLVTHTVEIIHAVDWEEKDILLLREHADLIGEMPERQIVDSVIASLEQRNWISVVWTFGSFHLLFWSILIFIYPKSTHIQAFFFWNPWVRRFFGFGYVGVMLTWVPFLRRKLFAPFKKSLLADADLENFDLNNYYAGSYVMDRSGIKLPICEAIPTVKGQIVFQGESGIGKTMFLRYLVQADNRIAVYLLAEKCDLGVEAAIQAKVYGFARNESFLRSLIYSKAIDIYIDGLNEVSPETRVKITSFVENNFKGNIIIGTQRLEWNPPPIANIYELQPLAREQIFDFLRSRFFDLPVDVKTTEENYLHTCSRYLEEIFDKEKSKEIFEANQKVLSNPMDLTVVAHMLARDESPDLLHLQQQQYNVMSEEYKLINLSPFPIISFSEEVYHMRLEDRFTLQSGKFYDGIACMERHKMIVKRHTVDGEILWRFRHDKVMEFFVAQMFCEKYELQTKHRGDPRFRGVYFLLAVLLPVDQAKLLCEDFINYAADTRDHSVSDDLIKLLRSRINYPT